jgi:membrane protease YdiL (CAAX protease family)
MTQSVPDPQPPPRRRFQPGATVLCLALWLLATESGRFLRAGDDPLAHFEHPAEVAVAAVERSLALLLGLARGAERQGVLEGLRVEGGAVRIDAPEADSADDGLHPLLDPAPRVVEGAELYLATAERLEGLVAAGTADDPQRAADAARELRVRGAVLARGGGLDPARWIGAAPTHALERAGQVAVGLRPWPDSAAEQEELSAAFEPLGPTLTRARLERGLAEAAGRPEVAATWTEFEADLADGAARRGAAFLGRFGPLALLGFLALLAAPFVGRAATRLDPPERELTWPAAGDGLGIFGRYVVGLVAIQGLLGLLFGSAALGVMGLLGSAALVGACLWRYGPEPGSPARHLGLALRPDRVLRLVPIVLAGWAATLIALVALASLAHAGEEDLYSNPVLDLLAGEGQGLRWRLLVEACLWAPLFEELGFRAALFGGLRSRFSFWPAALLSSVAFGAAHAYELVGTLAICGVGFVLAWVYERTRSLWACVLVHALFNLGQLQLSSLLFG